MSAPRVLHWVFNYMPQWEAVSKEIADLRSGLDGEIDGFLLSINDKVFGVKLRGREKRVPLPHSLPFYPLAKWYASRFDINHLFASAGERLLTPVIARRNGILTVAKDTINLRALERNRQALRRMRAVVVQGERDREVMRQIRVRKEALQLIRPGIPLAPYREPASPFTILFASSPLNALDFLSRGIYLITAVAAQLPEIRFLLIWRTHHLPKLERVLASTKVKNVVIRSGV
ncbi:MAG: hypothetical protein ABI037_06555, partial [Gemmatimonadales bacterium]